MMLDGKPEPVGLRPLQTSSGDRDVVAPELLGVEPGRDVDVELLAGLGFGKLVVAGQVAAARPAQRACPRSDDVDDPRPELLRAAAARLEAVEVPLPLSP